MRLGLGALLALALGAALLLGRPMPTEAQMGPMGSQPLDQLAGDDFDRAFLQQMIMHHAMAVGMAQPLAANASHPEAEELANTIIADQTREISHMRTWLKDWYGVEMPDPVGMMGGQPQGPMMGQPGQTGPMGPGMGPGHGPMMGPGPGAGPMAGQGGPMGPGQGMGPMGGMGMMADLWKLPPNRLESVFFSLMIPHHQGAIDAANLAPERASHQELKDLASSIVQSQTAEIGQMNAWLAGWYGL
jgi:uncharacterized protein (DUF305 family)